MGPSAAWRNESAKQMAIYNDMDEEQRTLVHDYGLKATLDALRLANYITIQARYILEERKGKPLVPRRR